MPGAGWRARAVVVGVERYEGGSAWDLDGPVSDALGYARWLLGAGLDPGQLTLLLSPLPRNVPDAERCGLPFRPADRETVHQVLFRELSSDTGDFLLVAWSGHGLVDPDGRRRLLYEDAVPDDIRSLDLDAALAAYRSGLIPSYPVQLWLIDACQVFADPAQVQGALRPDPVPTGRPHPRPAQYAIFACAPGGTARNSATARLGAFSSEALSLLTWPPEPAKIASGLRSRFEALGHESGAQEARQRPTYFWHTGPEGEGQYASPYASPYASAPRRPHSRDLRARPSLGQRKRLLEALEAIPAMADPATRGSVLSQLPVEIASSLPRSPITRVDLLGVIDTCFAFPDGLVRLEDAISMVDSGTLALDAFRRALAELVGDAGP